MEIIILSINYMLLIILMSFPVLYEYVSRIITREVVSRIFTREVIVLQLRHGHGIVYCLEMQQVGFLNCYQ